MSVIVVTGTSTGVGKTVVTAALATLARARGASVAVVKPAQTGALSGEPGDLDEVRRLAGVMDLHEYARYPDPLSPAAAARESHRAPLDLLSTAPHIADLAGPDLAAAEAPTAVEGAERAQGVGRLVLVEGAGGLLVRFDEDGTTLADLARELAAPVLVVTTAGLGTLNHTALTLEALAHRGIQLAGVVIGAWPAEPGLAERHNVRDLETIAARPLAGALPDGAGRLDPAEFLLMSRASLAPYLGGAFDALKFKEKAVAPEDGARDGSRTVSGDQT